MLLFPLGVLADGIVIGGEYFIHLSETNQLAIINLTESTADVSMFIAIEGIPAGKEITYILPFWYRPDGFSLAEEDASSFRETCAFPANNKLMRMQRIAAHHGSNILLTVAPFVSVGLPSLMIAPLLNVHRIKEERNHEAAVLSTSAIHTPTATLIPYATDETAHASVELYRIGEHDLQQLIQQSGLPTRYLKPLAKYRTPYFAVMRLKGLAIAENKSIEISGRGICYHFTHRITGGRYTYPLGTGAAWPQPIPLTEVYITCPDYLAMRIKAPVEGEKLDWKSFCFQENVLMRYAAESLKEKTQDRFRPAMKYFLVPYTSSLLNADYKRPFAWHIAYSQSNPAEDISVQLAQQFPPWRFAMAEYFALPGVPVTICIILYLLSWFATTWFVIRRRWQRAGTPGNLFIHGLQTFFMAQYFVGILAIVACGIIIVSYAIDNTPGYSWNATNRVWQMFPLPILVAGSLVAILLAIIFFMQLIAIARRLRTPIDRRKWLTLAFWLSLAVLFTITSVTLYQDPLQMMNAALLRFPLPIVIAGSLVLAISAIILFSIPIILTRRLIAAATFSIPTDWRKGLTFTCWLCSSFLFSIMAATLYGFLYWCETI